MNYYVCDSAVSVCEKLSVNISLHYPSNFPVMNVNAWYPDIAEPNRACELNIVNFEQQNWISIEVQRSSPEANSVAI